MNGYKLLWIFRGLPGSGKSSVAQELFRHDVIFEADKFFVNKETGEYEWNASKIQLAHEWCQSEVEKAMKSGHLDIAVCNTSTNEKELEPYIKLADKYAYKVISLIVENRHGNKNLHNVPDTTLDKMEQKLRSSIKLR